MIVFLHIPKTAGSTFQFILENTFGIFACHTDHNKRPRFGQDDYDFMRRFFPRLRSLAGHNMIDPLSLRIPGAFYMTFLRNPVARVFSHYQDAVQHGNLRLGFEETLRQKGILENLHVKRMTGDRDLDRAKSFLEKCSFVGLTEKFELSLHLLERISPYRLNLNYKRQRVARDNRIRQALEADSRVVDMTLEYNRLDLALYEFVQREIFPKLCAQARVNPADPVGSHDRYRTEIKWNYLLGHLYNMSFYRQICKLRNRLAARAAA